MADPITQNVDGVDVTIQPVLTGSGPAVTYLAPTSVAGTGSPVDPNSNTSSASGTFPGPNETTCHYVSKPVAGLVWTQVSSAADVSIVKICVHS